MVAMKINNKYYKIKFDIQFSWLSNCKLILFISSTEIIKKILQALSLNKNKTKRLQT
jgi:hypothetical protein